MYFPYSFFTSKHKVSGVDGDLVVNAGGWTITNPASSGAGAYTIPEGSTKRYRSVTVNVGGNIIITGNTGAITEIGIRNNFINFGTVTAQMSNSGVGTLSKTSVFAGVLLSYGPVLQKAGGNGANCYWNNTDGVGGLGSLSGLGGGGGGGGIGLTGFGPTLQNGDGGTNGASGTAGLVLPSTVISNGGLGGGFGAGSNGVISNGGAGASGGGGGTIYFSAAYGGGGGGYRGNHGKGLIIYCEGTISGPGSIVCAGQVGYNGGSSFDNGNGVGSLGGGGGSGAGGSGGRLWVYVRNTNSNILSTGGALGGVAGSGANAATNGQIGNNGAQSVVTGI